MIDLSQEPRAVLLDIDGTLVDSNYLHIEAWAHAFDEVDHPVDAWRIHRAIGMDGDSLINELLGRDAERLGQRASDLHAKHYASLADRLRPFDGARELLQELSDRGFTVVLATSAPEGELATLREVLDVDDSVDVVTSGDDVETAKPRPDIVQVALERAGVDAADAVLIGDTVWDAEAATRAGVGCVGVLTGGIPEPDLLAAGALAVVESVEVLRERLRGPGLLGRG